MSHEELDKTCSCPQCITVRMWEKVMIGKMANEYKAMLDRCDMLQAAVDRLKEEMSTRNKWTQEMQEENTKLREAAKAVLDYETCLCQIQTVEKGTCYMKKLREALGEEGK
jgi:FtsZ-binding cell division protein ZapB